MIEIGNWRIESVVNGHVRLDGGAMFGVVPKVLWEKVAPPDEQNRILLATRSLLAVHRKAGRIVLVDTGTGSKWPADKAKRYGVESNPQAIDDALARVGAAADDVTDIVVTHLHFDHCGGMTDWAGEPGGPTKLRFPNARHWIHQRHWSHAQSPTLRDRASFIADDFALLEEKGVLACVEGESGTLDLDDLTWTVSNGHTPAQLLPRFGEGGASGGVQFVGDLTPTSGHLPAAWVMAYDLEPLTTLNERLALYRSLQAADTLVAFPHDPKIGIARLTFEKTERPTVAEVLG